VPDVRGLQQNEATELLTAQGFTDVEIERVERSGADENEVVEQDPAPTEEEVPVESTTITLTVNSGAPPVEVPDVVEDTRRQARQKLNDVNLRVGDVSQEASDTVDEGLVIRSSPPAGGEVPENTEVDLVISTGSNQAEVPDVVDRLQQDAELALNDACEPQPCFGAFVSEEFSDSVQEGRVIRQSPEGGQQARKGSDVTLVISRGPEEQPEPEPTTTEVPNIIGDDIQDAQSELQEAGLAIGEVTEQPSDVYDVDEVIVTDPAPGEVVVEQTLVAIIVATGPGQTSGDGGGNGNGGGGNVNGGGNARR
jgi:serine/threonine-protein kinase